MVHLPFEDRVEAGRMLADELSRREPDRNAIVLALTRGGVPVGFAVSDRLRLPLDVIVVRKIGVPWQPELAMGALAGSVRVLDDRMIRQLEISNDELNETIAREHSEMERRERLFRMDKPALHLGGKTTFVIDDGLATGNTMLAAVRYVRSMNPAKVIIGVPVGSSEACRRLRKEADDLVCVAVPDPFFAVGEWYREFPQVSDAEVRDLLEQNRQRVKAYAATHTIG
jgi:putative phosphoribosyl transferase